MSDLKLFRLLPTGVEELPGSAALLEKSLQNQIEKHMNDLFGVRFLASEYSTGKKHGGRMDSLGIDENGSPVIFEYKRAANENVINQGLFYLDWLMDHRGDFELLVMTSLGGTVKVDWSAPRLICVAGDFNRYDEHAIAQMDRSIELVRYRLYPGDLLALDLVASTAAKVSSSDGHAPKPKNSSGGKTAGVVALHAKASPALKDLYDSLEQYLEALGDDVTKKVNQDYYAFRRLKNFACVEVHPNSGTLLVYLKVDPDSIDLQDGYTRDVRKVGHFGTGDLEVTIKSPDHLASALPLIQRSYDDS